MDLNPGTTLYLWLYRDSLEKNMEHEDYRLFNSQPLIGCEILGFKHQSRSIVLKLNNWLVVSNMKFIFHNIWDVILPIDFHIFQDG